MRLRGIAGLTFSGRSRCVSGRPPVEREVGQGEEDSDGGWTLTIRFVESPVVVLVVGRKQGSGAVAHCEESLNIPARGRRGGRS